MPVDNAHALNDDGFYFTITGGHQVTKSEFARRKLEQSVVPYCFVDTIESLGNFGVVCAQCQHKWRTTVLLNTYQQNSLFHNGDQVMHVFKCPACEAVLWMSLVPTTKLSPRGYVPQSG